jgi:hypothetical protein
MLIGTRQTHRLLSATRVHPSLLELQQALSMAESVVPARPPRIDANERLALQLIARMQANYKKSLPFLDLQDRPGPNRFREQFRELAGTHAR